MFTPIKEFNGKFKVFLYKEWCYLNEWSEEKQNYIDCIFNTRDEAEVAFRDYCK